MIQFKSLKRNQMDYSKFHQETQKNNTTLKCSMNLTVHRKSVNNITK